MPDKKCPTCGLWNTENAMQCDCGYFFDTKQVKAIEEVPSEGNEWAKLVNEVISLWQNGQQDRALVMTKQAINDAETANGPDHPNVAIRLNMLGELYENLGQKSQAESLFQRALEIDEKALGTNHPAVAISLNNLAVLYGSQGQYAQAEPLIRRALAIRELALGPDHPEVAAILINMAALCRSTQREKEAADLSERAQIIQREDAIRRLGRSPLRCQFSLKSVSIKHPTYTEWGDLFACENGLIYIYLSDNAGKVTIGGRMEDCNYNSQKRERDYGMSIEERIRKREWSLVASSSLHGKIILKGDVTSIVFHVGSTGFKIVHNNGEMNLGHEDASRCYKMLESWRHGTLKSEEDTQGANLGFPPVARLVNWLVDGSICNEVEQRILGEIPAQKVYMQAIFSLFEGLKRQEKEAVVNFLSVLPKDWVGAFRIYLENREIDAQRLFKWPLVGVILCAISAIYFLVTILALGQELTFWNGLSIVGSLCFPVSLYLTWYTSKVLRESKHLLSLIPIPSPISLKKQAI